MLTIILGFILASSFLIALMKCAGKPEPQFVPEPDVFDPESDPFKWSHCPACGCEKIGRVKMTRGIVVTHNCVGVPKHSQCQLDGYFRTQIEACGAWNRRVEQWITDHWITERDLTRPV